MSVVWEPVDIVLEAADLHDWWTFPVTADFTHEETGTRLLLEGFWNGDRDWVIRFAPTLVGTWTYETRSEDVGLTNQTGRVVVDGVSDEQ